MAGAVMVREKGGADMAEGSFGDCSGTRKRYVHLLATRLGLKIVRSLRKTSRGSRKRPCWSATPQPRGDGEGMEKERYVDAFGER